MVRTEMGKDWAELYNRKDPTCGWIISIYVHKPFIDFDVQRHSEDETSSSILSVVLRSTVLHPTYAQRSIVTSK
jgi:hypothetical protein